MSQRARRVAVAAALMGLVVAVGLPPRPSLGPAFTADRARVLQTADSILRAHRGNPDEWRRLATIGKDTLTAMQSGIYAARAIFPALREWSASRESHERRAE